MQERSQFKRGLEDISHYFITTKVEPGTQASTVNSNTPEGHFFFLGSQSNEGRALLASNLACVWSEAKKRVELVEEEKKIPNAHFLLGSLIPETGNPNLIRLNGSSPIELTSWNPALNGKSYDGKALLWNLSLESSIKVIPSLKESPRFLVVLEPDTKKLIKAYLEVRQVVATRPDACFFAVTYFNGSEQESHSILEFFQRIGRKFLNLEIRNAGFLRKDVTLAKSILSRTPVVLFSGDANPAKETIERVSQILLEI